MTTTVQKVPGALVLLVLGILSLRVASFLDGAATENWIILVQLFFTAIIGAVAALARTTEGAASSAERAAFTRPRPPRARTSALPRSR